MLRNPVVHCIIALMTVFLFIYTAYAMNFYQDNPYGGDNSYRSGDTMNMVIVQGEEGKPLCSFWIGHGNWLKGDFELYGCEKAGGFGEFVEWSY